MGLPIRPHGSSARFIPTSRFVACPLQTTDGKYADVIRSGRRIWICRGAHDSGERRNLKRELYCHISLLGLTIKLVLFARASLADRTRRWALMTVRSIKLPCLRHPFLEYSRNQPLTIRNTIILNSIFYVAKCSMGMYCRSQTLTELEVMWLLSGPGNYTLQHLPFGEFVSGTIFVWDVIIFLHCVASNYRGFSLGIKIK